MSGIATSSKTTAQPLREEISQFFLDTYLAQVSAAINAGTFDAEVDRHLSWKPVTLDRVAWKEIGRDLDDVLGWLPTLEAESIERTEEDVDRMIPTIVSLSLFRSPEP